MYVFFGEIIIILYSRWRRRWQPTPVLLPRKSHGWRSLVSMGSQRIGHDWATSLSLSSILAWKISWTEKSGGLQSMRFQRVRHDWMTKHVYTIIFFNMIYLLCFFKILICNRKNWLKCSSICSFIIKIWFFSILYTCGENIKNESFKSFDLERT